MDNRKKSFYLSWGLSLAILIVALIFSLFNMIGYGITLFCTLPIVIGITTGILPNKEWAILGGTVALVIFLILLVTGNIEGFICVLMAAPIITVLLFTGHLLVHFLRKLFDKQPENLNISLIIPILIFTLSSTFEFIMGDSTTKSQVTTSMIINDSQEEVYQKIIHVDTVNVEQTIYQKLGMPTPRKCTLTEERVGGFRICQFDEGTIVETIRDFKKNEFLRMGVTASDMLGMKWLKFDEDMYTIEKINGKTKITRTTSYYSDLKPRFYWQAIENITIGSEQEFVFKNLRKDLAKND